MIPGPLHRDGEVFCEHWVSLEWPAGRLGVPVRWSGGEVADVAALDTGAPFCVLQPELGDRLGSDGEVTRQLIRGAWRTGRLVRAPLTLLADDGGELVDALELEATVFLLDEEVFDLPTVLGLNGFLERLRWAVDPVAETFYFGAY